MYPLGILFGLGFDTSSEIALLGISSVEAAKGTYFWVILIFPALFTGTTTHVSVYVTNNPAGMCLIDTIDGALMLSLYIQPAKNFLAPKRDSATSETPLTEGEEIEPSQNHRDPVAFLYYSVVLTTLTVMVAIAIGVIQLLSLIQTVADVEGPFWDGVEVAGKYYDVIGGSICGCFIIVGGLSVVLYRPWRRRMARKFGQNGHVDEEGYRDDVADAPEYASNDATADPEHDTNKTAVVSGATQRASSDHGKSVTAQVAERSESRDEIHL